MCTRVGSKARKTARHGTAGNLSLHSWPTILSQRIQQRKTEQLHVSILHVKTLAKGLDSKRSILCGLGVDLIENGDNLRPVLLREILICGIYNGLLN